jgi:structural maintenance of chromosome 1
MHHACGNALVCDTMEVARFVCYEKKQEVKGEFSSPKFFVIIWLMFYLAVTLEGTVIHKAGLITGGRSTHGNGHKWEEKEVQGQRSTCLMSRLSHRFSGLNRAKETLLTQLRDLNKSKPRSAADENLIAEINRLESALVIAKDDLVCSCFCDHLNMSLTRL